MGLKVTQPVVHADPPKEIEAPRIPHALLGTDGACSNNPDGEISAGIHLITRPNGRVIVTDGHKWDHTGTNNESEFLAMIYGLEVALDKGVGHLRVVSDSQLMINCLTGKYKLSAANLKPLLEKALEVAGNFQEGVEFIHRPRTHWLCKICDANAARALHTNKVTNAPVDDELLRIDG